VPSGKVKRVNDQRAAVSKPSALQSIPLRRDVCSDRIWPSPRQDRQEIDHDEDDR
jgi:hypothetical protein